MTGEPEARDPRTEEEALASNARIKRALRWSGVFYPPVVALLLLVFGAPYWLGLTAIFVVIELIAYPVLAGALDRSTEQQIAAIREEHGGF